MNDRARYIWPAVVLAVVIVAAVTVLTALGKDGTVVLTVVAGAVLPVLAALLAGQVQTVKEQTNGNQSALLELIKRQSDIIAASPAVTGTAPPPDPEPATEPATEPKGTL